MTQETQSLSRREQILQALAQMLETRPGARITTSALAREVGVSEAALYRHFPSKAKMFEGLIEFIEDTIFTRISLILQEEDTTLARCEHLLTLVLAFAERNPGMCRLMTGDALAGEKDDRLRNRMVQFFDRLEAQLKQVLRESELREGLSVALPVSTAASMLLAVIEGRIIQFVRSGFRRKPTDDWSNQWQFLSQSLLCSESKKDVPA
ncbi:nucleoid occlusion factor SlmA [Terasakiispira papahanaumokuakeensis]|uniref:Nucleoid occlusion factor SlmA n=1 Tax=Terasakiispira papahanaumokuakeensis TaxID=197479 RepID=A0A1E2V5W1_9GAMM|nr:nucleoid occlusion factor SlmA [Terasakiispira papahanaumokuakeensis]ODC02364.1 nucleoid occlusion factor SlmA [Terasakiispira papahanaumokuakeensis]